jgi:hypothetical protein
VNELDFVHADPTSPAWRSPIGTALADAPPGIRDVTAEIEPAAVAGLGPAAGVAGIELTGQHAAQLLRRLTALNAEALPAIQPVAGVRTLVVAHGPDRLRMWFPQEYADHMAACVLDAAAGIAWA